MSDRMRPPTPPMRPSPPSPLYAAPDLNRRERPRPVFDGIDFLGYSVRERVRAWRVVPVAH